MFGWHCHRLEEKFRLCHLWEECFRLMLRSLPALGLPKKLRGISVKSGVHDAPNSQAHVFSCYSCMCCLTSQCMLSTRFDMGAIQDKAVA